MRIRRRDLLLASTALAACAPVTRPVPSAAGDGPTRLVAPRRVLVLGGTSFLGPEIVEVLKARGHTITLFNRGKTNPHLFPELEKLHGDRKTGDYASLRGRRWDVVIDTSAYFPRVVREAAAACEGAELYVLVSTISVYDKPPRAGVDERGAVGRLGDPGEEKVGEATYGPLKAACEAALADAAPGRGLVVRPGLIVGPSDPTDRFTYWPVRVAEGGRVLAPGGATDPAQVIDVRDLAAWMGTAITAKLVGTFNAVGPAQPTGMGGLLDAVKAGVGGDATFAWADAKLLEKEGVKPWSDMPVWIPSDDEDAGMARVSSARAIAAGLTFRPLAETARDTLAWWRTLPEERRAKPKAGLPRAREAAVLAALDAARR